MPRFKLYACIQKQASLNVDNSHTSLYGSFFEMNKNE